MKKFLMYCCVLCLCAGCGISHTEEDIIITDMNGYFNGTIHLTYEPNGFFRDISVQAAIVQTQDDIYGTFTGVFGSVQEEVIITGRVSGYSVTIDMKEGIGPVTLTGTAQDRNITLTGAYTENGQAVNVSLFLESENIMPIIHEPYYSTV